MAEDIEWHRKQLVQIRKLKGDIEDQIAKGWCRRDELPHLEELEEALEAYEVAVDGGDDIEILLEEAVVDRIMRRGAAEVLESKVNYTRRMGLN